MHHATTVAALSPSLLTFSWYRPHLFSFLLWSAGFPIRPTLHQRVAVDLDLHLSRAPRHRSGFDLWCVDKQDKRSPSASLYASLLSLYQRRRHLLPLQGCTVLPCLASTKPAHIVGQFFAFLHALSLIIALSLSLSFALPLTEVGCHCQNCWQESRVSVSFRRSWNGWKDGGSGGKMEGWEDYLRASAKSPSFGVFGIRKDDLDGDTAWWHHSWPLASLFHHTTQR